MSEQTETIAEWETGTIQRCACGGFLAADFSDWRAVRAVVEKHRWTRRHRAWAKAKGFEP